MMLIIYEQIKKTTKNPVTTNQYSLHHRLHDSMVYSHQMVKKLKYPEQQNMIGLFTFAVEIKTGHR